MAEGQIYSKLQEIEISVTSYKLRGASDKQATHRVIAGFTGTLKNWWDNYLTEQDKGTILNAMVVKTIVKEENGASTSTEVRVEDSFPTLVYSIAKHFIKEPRLFQDRSLEILNNLYCKKLTDWKWYKDMFITKVMIRQDCNNDYWKEHFISGLPSHFAEKVRSKIKDRCEGKIPYNLLSYGDLITVLTIVAMELCTDLKLKEQLNRDKRMTSAELGSFCQDFGFPSLKPPSANKADKNTRQRNQKVYKRNESTKTKDHKHKRKSKGKTSKDSSSEDTCWTCGKKGHRSNLCPRNKKKKKKISVLKVDEEIKNKLFSILEEEESESDFE
nr:uncharacterized protein LOC109119544 [Solanum lycopersicum]